MQLLTVEKLSEQLDVPKSWIYRHVRDKKHPLPHLKLSKYLRFDPDEIEEYLNQNRR